MRDRSFALHVALLLAGTAISLWGSSVDWITWTQEDPGLPAVPGGATGHELSASMRAVALVVLAAVPALFALHRAAVRRFFGGFVGFVGGISMLGGVLDAMAYRRRPVLADLAGCVSCVTDREGPQLGPAVVALGALVLLVAGVVASVAGRSWQDAGSSYQVPGRDPEPPVTDKAVWDALDRGQDPTADPTA